MVSIDDLNRIRLFRGMDPELLAILAAEAQLSIFNTHTQLSRIGQKVDALYMLLMGQVAMKVDLVPGVEVIIDLLQSGSAFGLSSLITDTTASATAVCQEPCEVITLAGDRMLKLFDDNPELGFQVMLRLAAQYKEAAESRSQMILKTLDEHPEFKDKIMDLDILTPAFH